MQRIKDELRLLEENGQYRKIPDIQGKFHNNLVIDNKHYINLASNDYLGLSTRKELIQEFLSTKFFP